MGVRLQLPLVSLVMLRLLMILIMEFVGCEDGLMTPDAEKAVTKIKSGFQYKMAVSTVVKQREILSLTPRWGRLRCGECWPVYAQRLLFRLAATV